MMIILGRRNCKGMESCKKEASWGRAGYMLARSVLVSSGGKEFRGGQRLTSIDLAYGTLLGPVLNQRLLRVL